LLNTATVSTSAVFGKQIERREQGEVVMRCGLTGLTVVLALTMLSNTFGQENPTGRGFALDLVRGRIPAGIVASEQEWKAVPRNVPDRAERSAASDLSDVDGALRQFNAAGSSFHAARKAA
jgi:hypothetical protein